MSFMDRMLDRLSEDREWRAEEEQWRSSGQYPDEVARDYRDEKVYQEDEKRLHQLGYRPCQHETVGDAEERDGVVTYASNLGQGPAGGPAAAAAPDPRYGHVRVTYRRDAGPLLSAGARFADDPKPGPG